MRFLRKLRGLWLIRRGNLLILRGEYLVKRGYYFINGQIGEK